MGLFEDAAERDRKRAQRQADNDELAAAYHAALEPLVADFVDAARRRGARPNRESGWEMVYAWQVGKTWLTAPLFIDSDGSFRFYGSESIPRVAGYDVNPDVVPRFREIMLGTLSH